MLESTPPERYEPTGTSARSRLLHGAEQDLLKAVHQRPLVFAALLLARIGEIHLPVAALAHRAGAAALVSRRDLEVAAGREELHPFKAGDRAGHGGESEDVIDPAQVRPGGDHPGGQQRLDLGGKEQPVALPAPVERGDAEAVAREQELAPALIPEREGKLPAQLLEHALLIFLPQVREDLRVAVRDQPMPARLATPRAFRESRTTRH